jgi:hypothetical protein
MEETPRPAERTVTPPAELDDLGEIERRLDQTREVMRAHNELREDLGGNALWIFEVFLDPKATGPLANIQRREARRYAREYLASHERCMEAGDEWVALRKREDELVAAQEAARKADGPRADAEVKVLDAASYYTTTMAAAEPSGTWSGGTSKSAGLGQS